MVGACDAYEKAVELEPANAQAKSGLAAVKRAIDAEAESDGAGAGGLGGLGNMFNDPQMMQKLANNPKTKNLITDPDFMQKLQRLQKDPSKIGEALGGQRFLSVMGVLMGVDMSFGNPADMPKDSSSKSGQVEAEEDVPMPDLKPAPAERATAPEPEAEPETEEDKASREAKTQADEEKRLGTEAYKKRDFDPAIAHYQKAWELHKDIAYLTNLSAAQFEKGDYQAAIEACQKAIEHGKEVMSNFKIMAKAYGRLGSSYEKLGDLASAITNYHKSLTEHRTPEILAKLRTAEKQKDKVEKDAYMDPAKAEEARELGSQRFKDADWPGAVEAYSEMIKRAPEDPRGYSNRAACFVKLLGFPSAVQDCDAAIAKDPKFIRAHIRKAQALFAMREYNRCIDACTQASAHDTDGKNARDIEAQAQKALQAQYTAHEGETEEQTSARIQRDPEILAILQGETYLCLHIDIY